MMMDKVSVVRNAESLDRGASRASPSFARAYAHAGIDDQGTTFNTDLTEALELGCMLDCAETIVEGALAREESRGAHYRDDFREARRRQLARAHHDHARRPAGSSCARSRSRSRVSNRRSGSTRRLGTAASYDPTDQGASVEVTLRIKRYNPDVDVKPHLRGVRGRRRAERPGARRPERDQVAPGRHAHLPALLRPRHLRLGRDAHQRPQPPGLQDPDEGVWQEDHHRAADRVHGHQGSRRRHGPVLRRLQGGQALPDRRRRPGVGGAAADPGAARPLRRHHQVHPLRRLHDRLPDHLDQREFVGPAAIVNAAPLHLRQPRPRAPPSACAS